MKSILVAAGRDPGMAARLDTALALARWQDAHVTLLVDTPLERFMVTDPFGGSYIAREALEDALLMDDTLAHDIATRLARGDVPFDVVQSELGVVEAFAEAGRLADLVIVPRDALAGDIAVALRCPVLALSDGAMPAFPLDAACIAWDGTDTAALALRGAAPLLVGCGQVSVLEVDGASDDFPATDALRYLSRHGIKAELVPLAKGGSVEETLANAVIACGAQLLVMGAFGHSRVREMLLGGVTRYFLTERAGPSLLLAN